MERTFFFRLPASRSATLGSSNTTYRRKAMAMRMLLWRSEAAACAKRSKAEQLPVVSETAPCPWTFPRMFAQECASGSPRRRTGSLGRIESRRRTSESCILLGAEHVQRVRGPSEQEGMPPRRPMPSPLSDPSEATRARTRWASLLRSLAPFPLPRQIRALVRWPWLSSDRRVGEWERESEGALFGVDGLPLSL